MTVKPVMYQNNAGGRKGTSGGFQSSQDGSGSVTGHSPSRQEKHPKENNSNLSAGDAKKMSWSDIA